ncbi:MULTISPECIES: indole-3-glycerol phosphate synthase TrpC [unclassified Azospirillum]|uniref:indole-3-glycerol phosphate synthase TrpC n=1 Tax=unclassified Azospirillum TaxID=2630922 RepID=UPI000B6E52F1|nr:MULTISPECIES: indole-3-glycerol phosphate synthase TrpC [unclassified Azospirillum]SNS22281.1 indole-3-glycerol phosphate synthase [Azospirillum sp. RU38E]SNS40260.1 indole-3-glycerol phosphate synthase [Azospirillum sp. RU37A]
MNSTPDVLARICADKAEHVARAKAARPLALVEEAAKAQPASRGFAAALSRTVAEGRWALIAEIKKASPSKGLIRADFDPPTLARAYKEAGATCLSVLTDIPYFQGDDAFLQAARAAVDLPALRKDFMIDPYQIAESRALGADCILLIMACLDDALARDLYDAATGYGMDVLVEVHDEAEMERALTLPGGLLGVNNRNLKTLSIDLATTERLAAMVPAGRHLVAESGIHSPADLSRLAGAGARRFLIGESLMAKPDVVAATRALLSTPFTPAA